MALFMMQRHEMVLVSSCVGFKELFVLFGFCSGVTDNYLFYLGFALHTKNTNGYRMVLLGTQRNPGCTWFSSGHGDKLLCILISLRMHRKPCVCFVRFCSGGNEHHWFGVSSRVERLHDYRLNASQRHPHWLRHPSGCAYDWSSSQNDFSGECAGNRRP